MPSSHFRVEEASSIAASKSGNADDDLNDFVLQIDENEINNELNSNGLVSDIDAFKQKNKGSEGALSQLGLTKKINLDDQQPTECENGVKSGENNNHQNDLHNVKEVEKVEKIDQLISNPNLLENVFPIENILESKAEAMDAPKNVDNNLESNLSIGIEGGTNGPEQQCDIAENLNPETNERIQSQIDSVLPVTGEELRKMENENVEDAPNEIDNISDVSSSNEELESIMNNDVKEINDIENGSNDGDKESNKDEKESNNDMKVNSIEEKETNKDLKELNNVDHKLNNDDEELSNDDKELNIENRIEPMEDENESNNYENKSIKDENESVVDENESVIDENESIVYENELDNCEDETNNYDDESYNCENELDNCEEDTNNYDDESNNCGNELDNCEEDMNNYDDESNYCENELDNCEDETNNFDDESNNCENELDGCEDETNNYDNDSYDENFESVDRELDSLLGEGEDSQGGRSESMEVDVPDGPNMEQSDSMSVNSADVDELLDSPGADDPVYSPGVDDPEDSDSYDSEETSCNTYSSGLTMHSAVSLTDGSGYIFSNCKSEDASLDTNQTYNESLKHTSASEKDRTIRSQKRNKREKDSINSRKKKRVKLDEEANAQQTKGLKKKLDDPIESQARKKNKHDPELEFDDTEVNDNMESNEPVEIDRDQLNGEASINEVVKKVKEKLTWETKEIPPETMEEIIKGRERLFANYFEGNPDILLNRVVLEEMVMAQLIEFITYKCEMGQLRQKCRVLESEQIRMNQMVYGLKKQVEDAKYILRRFIDDKKNNVRWTENAIPLKVTRSVGLQVSTCGPMTVRSRYPNLDNRPQQINRIVRRESLNVNHSSIQTNLCSKNMAGSSENKENIPINIESDDVLIASTTENTKSEITSSIAVKTEEDTAIDGSPENDIKKPIKTLTNGIISSEKNRDSFSFEQTISTQVLKTEPTTTIPDIENTDLDITPKKKEPAQIGKSDQNGGEIIDLTDKEDQPVIKLEKTSDATPSKQSTADMISKTSTTNSCSSAVIPLMNGIKKSPPSTIATIKTADTSAGADLVNSYDQLPKYPASPKYPANVTKPPRPIIKIGRNTSGKRGILLSWSFEGGNSPPNIEEYQLYAFQESKSKTPEKVKSETWKKIGDIKALPLPMACFLTQFLEGDKYHFIVRAVDSFKRLGDFSLPGSIILHAAVDQPQTTS